MFDNVLYKSFEFLEIGVFYLPFISINGIEIRLVLVQPLLTQFVFTQ